MSKEVSRKPYRIYDKGTRQWFEVTPEQYAEFDQWRTNKRKREQYHGRCMCPRNKWWLCDGLCDDCEFHAPGDMLSLDKPVSSLFSTHWLTRLLPLRAFSVTKQNSTSSLPV